jgi:hypothetical protein
VDLELAPALGLCVWGAKHVHVEAWLPYVVQQCGNKEDAPVVECQTQLTAVRPNHRIMHGLVVELLYSVNDTAKVFDGGDDHARQTGRSANVLNQNLV